MWLPGSTLEEPGIAGGRPHRGAASQSALRRHVADRDRAESDKSCDGAGAPRMKVVIGLVEHLGDIVACEPVARYVKAKYPGCKVSWVVNDTFRELVDYNPYIDATVTVECLTDWIKFTKHQAYDRIIDLHVNYQGVRALPRSVGQDNWQPLRQRLRVVRLRGSA